MTDVSMPRERVITMADRDKVIEGLRHCSCCVPDACSDCTYDTFPPRLCVQHLTGDALELLNDTTEWNPVDPDRRGYSNVFECNECGGRVYYTYWVEECDYNFCPWCGRRTR